MKLRRPSLLILSIIALAGAGFLAGCNERKDADKTVDTTEDTGDNTAGAVKKSTD